MCNNLPQGKIQRFAAGHQLGTAATSLCVRQRRFTESHTGRTRAIQIIKDGPELAAIHMHRFFCVAHFIAHSPTAVARRGVRESRSFSTNMARALCNRERTVPTGQSSAAAASS